MGAGLHRGILGEWEVAGVDILSGSVGRTTRRVAPSRATKQRKLLGCNCKVQAREEETKGQKKRGDGERQKQRLGQSASFLPPTSREHGSMSSYAPKPSESPSKPSRKRSASPAVASASASSSTPPNAKKGNYERKLGGATGAAKTLLSTAVHNAQTANATPPHPTPFARERENTPNRGAGGSSSDSAKRGAYVRPESTSSESSRCPSESTPTAATGRGEDREDPASARRQFEQQEDFVSFGEEEVVEERHSPRYGPGSRTSAHKRRYEGVDDEKMEQGTQRLAKRERERSTPWCYEPGVDWDKCQSAIDM